MDTLDLAKAELRPLAEKVWRYCEAHDITGKTITVKINIQIQSRDTQQDRVGTCVRRRHGLGEC